MPVSIDSVRRTLAAILQVGLGAEGPYDIPLPEEGGRGWEFIYAQSCFLFAFAPRVYLPCGHPPIKRPLKFYP